MDLIEDIGPILGIAAFLGFAILALLIVLQAREVRRLREWAGRAPERALDADEATQAAAEARGEATRTDDHGPLARTHDRLAESLGSGWDALDRQSPVDPKWLVGALAVALVAIAAVTGGFGLVGDDGEPNGQAAAGGAAGGQQEREPRPAVAVLNATQVDDVAVPVPAVGGMADVVASEVVRPAGFRVPVRADAPAGEETSVIMFEPGAESAAQDLADAVEQYLGETETTAMTAEISDLAEGTDLALLVGQDDAGFGQAGAP